MEYLSQPLTIILLCLIIAAVAYYPVWRVRRRGRYSPFSENRLRLPGESLRSTMWDLQGKFALWYFLLYVVLMAFFLLPTVLIRTPFGGVFLLSIGLVLLSLIAVRIIRIVQSLFDYKLGAEGEEYTGQELNLLARYGAFVFHDIPYKYGNIDHVVVGYDNIFVVETKSVRKPAGQSGKKESRVEYDGRKLRFPHFTTDAPLRQAQCHADCLARILNEDGRCSIPVVPVVALPGWYIDRTNCTVSAVRVINPKRGNSLRKQIGQRRSCDQFNSAVRKIEQLARVNSPLASITDPDAAEHYNLWTNEPRDKRNPG